MPSFIFGGDTGETAESLKRKRAMAEAMMARGASGPARNLGEGISSAAQSVAGALMKRNADKKIDTGRAEATKVFEAITKGGINPEGGTDVNALYGAMSHPHASDSQRQVLQAMLGQANDDRRFKREDERYAERQAKEDDRWRERFDLDAGLKREMAHIRARPRAATTPAEVREHQYYMGLSPEERVLWQQRARSAQLIDLGDRTEVYDPLNPGGTQGTYYEGVAPERKIEDDRIVTLPGVAGGPNGIGNTGMSGPDLHSARTGSPNIRGGGVSVQELPPSPADAKKEQLRQQNRARAGGTVIQDVNRALEMVRQNPGMTTGFGAKALSSIPMTDAKTVQGHIDSALSNVGLDTLQAMREASPTGGALGQVPIQQQQRLEQVLGSLDPTQRPEVVEDNLRRVSNIYMDIVYGTPEQIAEQVEAGLIPAAEAQDIMARHPLSFDEFGRTIGAVDRRPAAPVTPTRTPEGPGVAPPASPPPADVDPALWEAMTPEERALWTD